MKRSIIFLIIFYFFNHGLMLFNSGVFWDDWVIFNMKDEGIFEQYTDNGVLPTAYIHVLINKFRSPVFLNRFLSFISLLLTALLFFKILSTVNIFSNKLNLIVSSLFISVPMYSARISMMTLPGKIFLLCYFIALLLYVKYLLNHKTQYRIFAHILFITSFMLPSLIPFYYCCILVISIFIFKPTTIKSFLAQSMRFFDFLIMPIFCWVVYSNIFKPDPNGIHAALNYNSIHVYNLIKFPLLYKFSLLNLFVESVNRTNLLYSGFITPLIMIAFFTVIIWIVFANQFRIVDSHNGLFWIISIIIGFSLIGFAGIAYIIVGKMPAMEDGTFCSRYQILLGAGISIVIVAIVEPFTKFFKSSFLSSFIYLIIFVLFFSSNQYSYLEYQRDSYKQLSIMKYLFDNKGKIKGNTILINDKSSHYNAFGREISFYEYSGMFKFIFSDEDKLGITLYNFQNLKKWYGPEPLILFEGRSSYNLSNYSFQGFDGELTINNNTKWNSRTTLTLIFFDWFDHKDLYHHLNTAYNIIYLNNI